MQRPEARTSSEAPFAPRGRWNLAWRKIVWGSLLACSLPLIHGQGVPWSFDPPKIGNVLQQGGWSVTYGLGEVAGSPEFTFPLQLVYGNDREERGFFGAGWFCPQLDSRVVPRGNGMFVWQMPSGGMMGFRHDPKNKRNFRSLSGDWQARVAGPTQEIWNDAGWKFRYERSRLITVTSPGSRSLSFVWKGKQLQEIRVGTGPAGAPALTVVRLAYADGDDRIAGLEVQGRVSRFGYAPGKNGQLGLWTPPIGPRRAFGYSKEGVLASTQLEKGARENFRTEFVASGKGDQADRAKPANWWLMQDGNFLYTYGKGKSGNPIRDQVTIADRAGRTRSVAQVHDGMQIRESVNGVERNTYFYRAPGQKYNGKLRMIEEGGRTLVEYRYDRKSGLLTESIDQDGIITFYDYPPGARKGKFVAGEKGAAARLGKPIRVRQGTRKQSEVIAQSVYDDYGRLTAEKDRAGNLTKVSYTPRGEVASVEDGTGSVTRFAYDALGRRIGVEKNGAREAVTYDAYGRIAGKQDADGSKSEFAYDARGQLTQVKKNGQTLTEYLRNPLGLVIGEKDPLGRVKKFDYDDRGNLLAEHAPNGATTRYEYDATDHRIAQTDGNGNRIRFDYDLAGRLIKQTNPLGKTLAWIYDHKGKLAARTNGVQTIGYLYDDAQRLRRIDYAAPASAAIPAPAPAMSAPAVPPAPVASYFGVVAPSAAPTAPRPPPAAVPPSSALLPAGAVAQKSPSTQTIDYRYDAQGRMTSAETPTTRFEYLRDRIDQIEALRCVERGPDGKDTREQLLRYRYDTTGRRTGLILAELVPAVTATGGQAGRPAEYRTLQQTEYTYDSAGRLATILDNGTPAVSYRYDAASRLAGKTFGNGIQTAISYDAMGRLAKMEFSGGPLPQPQVLEYTWDVASQVTKRSWNGETQRYEYDPGGQLLKVINADTKEVLEAYTYDKAGNMREKTINGEKTIMTYNAANELATRSIIGRDGAPPPSVTSAAPTIAYRYDRAGRMLGAEGGPESTYGWLDKVTALKLPGGQKVTYTYWPDGQLATKQLQSPANRAENTNAGGGIQRISNPPSTINSQPSTATEEQFLWDGLALLRRSDTVYLIEPHPSGGVPIASHPVGASGPVTYYLNDLLGTTLATIEGTSTEYVKLTSFGQQVKAANLAPSPIQPSIPSVPANQQRSLNSNLP